MKNEKTTSLALKAKNGDGAALNELLELHYNDIYYYALSTLKNAEDAADATQEACVEIVKSIKSLTSPEAFYSWAITITHRKAMRFFTAEREVVPFENEDGSSILDGVEDDDDSSRPDLAYENEEFRATLASMINSLAPEQRSAIMLHYYEEMSVKDIASIQNVSEGTVKSRLSYGRRAMRNIIEDYERKSGVRLHSAAVGALFMLFFGGEKGVVPATLLASLESATAEAATASGFTCASTATTATTATAVSASGATATAGATAAATSFFATAIGKVVLSAAGLLLAGALTVASLSFAGVLRFGNGTEDTTHYTEGTPDNSSPEGDETKPQISVDTTTPETVHVHSFDTERIAKAPGCTEDGEKEYICSCGERQTETLLAIGHNYIDGKCQNCTSRYSIGLEYKLSDDGTYYILCGIGTCKDTELIIPSTHEGKPVYHIADGAFMNNETLTSVSVPSSVNTIGNDAFSDCYNIKALTLEDGIETIGNGAFCRCARLTSLTIPESVINIGVYAFVATHSLESIIINSTVVNIGEQAFADLMTLGTLEINSVTVNIAPMAFAQTPRLETLKIVGENASIGEIAFSGSHLKTVYIPHNTTIGEGAFEFCVYLETIYYDGTISNWNNLTKGEAWDYEAGKMSPNGEYEVVCLDGKVEFNFEFSLSDDEDYYIVESIGTYRGNEIVIPSEYHGLPVRKIGERAFEGNGNIETVEIPSSVLEIGQYAFSSCSALRTVTIESGLTTIGEGAFGDCERLASVSLPETLKVIGNYAFLNSAELNNIQLPESLEKIGFSVFSGCAKLKTQAYGNCLYLASNTNPYFAIIECKTDGNDSITLHKDTQIIATGANASGLTLRSVLIDGESERLYVKNNCLIDKSSGRIVLAAAGATIPSDKAITTIGSYAFSCLLENVSTLLVPNNITIIEDYAFLGSNFTSISLSENVTRIGDCAFWGCAYLENVTLPESLVYISDSAFFDCPSLKYNKYEGGLYIGNESSPYLALVGIEEGEMEILNVHTDTKIIVEYVIHSNIKTMNLSGNILPFSKYLFFPLENLKTINYDGTLADWAEKIKNCEPPAFGAIVTINCTDGSTSFSTN